MRCLQVMAAAILLLGCTPEPPREQTDAGQAAISDQPDAGRFDATSFGIANTFSGKLSEEQERTVPQALRGAFVVESLREITPTELARELESKTQVAEETRDGRRYVALQDFRCVQFSDDVSGQMIVIERYVVLSK